MSKSKHKSRGGHHVKYTAADQKENFCRRIRSVCLSVGGPGVYEMIPSDGLKKLHNMRLLPIKLVCAPHEQIPEPVIRKMRGYLAALLQEKKVPACEGGPEITLTDYLSAAEALNAYLRYLKDNEFPNARAFKKAMEPLMKSGESGRMAALNVIFKAINYIEILFTDLRSRLYSMKLSYRYRGIESRGIEQLIMVHPHFPEQIQMVVEGVSRLANKVCWVSSESGNPTYGIPIFPEQLGIETHGEAGPIEIYVQMHALQRLEERLDCINVGITHLNLCLSLVDPVVRQQGNRRYLIEYRLCEKKAGYLVAEMKDGKLLIRTFLFVTNSGTPEGNRLQEICGLRKLDRQFLAIDRLSTFVATDIRSDKSLEKLFVELGCSDLLDLHDNIDGIGTLGNVTSSMAMLRKYLGLDSTEDFMAPDALERVRRRFA